ncbi:hypothetical protein B0H11DRAFT_2256186 [Mycena galericulata]|nr:hypothetical protein B0H11DRAFT_2256186 [Mycena galericulata]
MQHVPRTRAERAHRLAIESSFFRERRPLGPLRNLGSHDTSTSWGLAIIVVCATLRLHYNTYLMYRVVFRSGFGFGSSHMPPPSRTSLARVPQRLLILLCVVFSRHAAVTVMRARFVLVLTPFTIKVLAERNGAFVRRQLAFHTCDPRLYHPRLVSCRSVALYDGTTRIRTPLSSESAWRLSEIPPHPHRPTSRDTCRCTCSVSSFVDNVHTSSTPVGSTSFSFYNEHLLLATSSHRTSSMRRGARLHSCVGALGPASLALARAFGSLSFAPLGGFGSRSSDPSWPLCTGLAVPARSVSDPSFPAAP